MRNLKRVLSLVLAAMMLIGMMVIGASAAGTSDFGDAEKVTYNEAVDVITGLGIMEGYDNGDFGPGDTLTREQAAKIISILKLGTDKVGELGNNTPIFTDVPAGWWSAGYIAYCNNARVMVGYGNGAFGRTDELTGVQFGKMLLVAMGYDPALEGYEYDPNWDMNVASQMYKLGVYVPGTDLSAPLTREQAAQMAFLALQANMVEYRNTVYGTRQAVPAGGLLGDSFGLTKIAGEVTAVDRAKGTATIVPYEDYTAEELAAGRFTSYIVSSTDIDWTNIGYAVSLWGVPNGNIRDVNKYAAVSDKVITGESLLINTADTKGDNILELAAANRVKVAKINSDADIKASLKDNNANNDLTSARIYFNGERISVVDNDITWDETPVGYYYNVDTGVLRYHVKDATSATSVDLTNGVKVDYIDNDNGGEAEAIVVTEYTVATVDGIANEQNTGHNAIVRDNYYFEAYNLGTTAAPHTDEKTGTTVRCHKDNLVTADDLAVGDVVTYVAYRGDLYVTESVPTVSKLNKVNSSRLNDEISYVFGDGDPMYKAGKSTDPKDYAQAYYRGDLKDGDYLAPPAQKNIGEIYAVYTDPYGYIIAVAENVTALDYLYVAQIDHSSSVDGIAKARVVYTDGTVEVVYIDEGYNESLTAKAGQVYSYTVDSDGYIKLGGKACTDIPATLTKNTTTLAKNVYVDNDTTFIDVTKVNRNTTEVNTYTRKDISGSHSVSLHCIMDGDMVVWAFVDEDTPDAVKSAKEFIVYQTNFATATDKTTHILDVLMNGEETTVNLSDAQYADVIDLGVGIYSYDKEGVLTYTAFPEVWEAVEWSKGTLIIKSGDHVGEGFYYDDDVTFYTLDIESGEVYGYEPYFGSDWYDADDAMAYLVEEKGDVTEIYVVYGTLVDFNRTTDTTKDDNAVASNYKKVDGDKALEYHAKDGYITSVDNSKPAIAINGKFTGGAELPQDPVYALKNTDASVTYKIPSGYTVTEVKVGGTAIAIDKYTIEKGEITIPVSVKEAAVEVEITLVKDAAKTEYTNAAVKDSRGFEDYYTTLGITVTKNESAQNIAIEVKKSTFLDKVKEDSAYSGHTKPSGEKYPNPDEAVPYTYGDPLLQGYDWGVSGKKGTFAEGCHPYGHGCVGVNFDAKGLTNKKEVAVIITRPDGTQVIQNNAAEKNSGTSVTVVPEYFFIAEKAQGGTWTIDESQAGTWTFSFTGGDNAQYTWTVTLTFVD